MTTHTGRKHRRFSPSASERFINCTGSTNLLARVPARPPNPYAIEGTKAHEVLEAALVNGIRKASVAHREYSSVCMEDLNTFDNFFYYAIDVALNHIWSIMDEYPDAVMYTEKFVNPPVENAPDEAGGWCDCAIHVPSIRTLFVIDYKHGAGVAKAVKGNTQVKQYAAGFLFEDNPTVDPETVDTVVPTIIQPRAFHEDGMVRDYELTTYEIWEYLEELDDAIAANLADDAPLTPGEDQCRFCDAKTVCPAREARALQVASTTFKQIEDVGKPKVPSIHELDIPRMAYISQHAPMLRKWLDDIDAHLEELARSGHHIPGKKLVETQARRKWYGDDETAAKNAASLIGCKPEDLMTTKILPLTQVEKLVVEAYKKRVGRGKKQQAAEDARQAFAFCTLKQSSGNLVLVDEDDSRPAVNRAVDTFTQIQAALPATSIGEEK